MRGRGTKSKEGLPLPRFSSLSPPSVSYLIQRRGDGTEGLAFQRKEEEDGKEKSTERKAETTVRYAKHPVNFGGAMLP